MNPVLCEVRRGGRVESVHRGAVVVMEGKRVLFARGDVGRPVFMRSCAKPFQCLTVVESGAADAFRLAPEELAIISSSHGGERHQVRAVLSVLKKGRLAPGALQCGAHPPYSSKALRELHRSGKPPSALHNNCSGKHSGMLCAALHQGFSIATYLDPKHPVQRENLETVARFTGVPSRKIGLGIDGCSAPTFALPLRAMARGMAAFCAEKGAPQRVREAILGNLPMAGRLAGEVMSALPGKVLAKEGAEGAHLCGLSGSDVAVALKIEDGSSRPVVYLLAAIFKKLKLGDLSRLADPVLKNHAGRVVGEIRDLIK